MIVLDTHVFVWLAASPDRLSSAARGAIELEGEPAISTITVQEVAYLVVRDRLTLDRPVEQWVADALHEHEIEPLAPGVGVAARAGSLKPGEFPGDPADRIIYATALEHGARLITADARLRSLDPARCVW